MLWGLPENRFIFFSNTVKPEKNGHSKSEVIKRFRLSTLLITYPLALTLSSVKMPPVAYHNSSKFKLLMLIYNQKVTKKFRYH